MQHRGRADAVLLQHSQQRIHSQVAPPGPEVFLRIQHGPDGLGVQPPEIGPVGHHRRVDEEVLDLLQAGVHLLLDVEVLVQFLLDQPQRQLDLPGQFVQ
jgi:hypothetical protein